ncbi:CMRF35-like molecule 1 [Amia ocellicauda]|uniref:CMRF35-like molecule 1 n=1 Tax=Amia ocellicauda TaxID=2972642 RepID=UPI0034647EEF
MSPSLCFMLLLVVLGCVQSRRVTGVEGGRVEINCTYEDGYQYYVKYWCREPCENKDVLINSVQADITVTAGRFTLTNYVSAMIFTVWMTRLTLQDAGIYYCGVEKWGKDIYGEIHLIISKAPTVSILSTPGPVTVETTVTVTPTTEISTQAEYIPPAGASTTGTVHDGESPGIKEMSIVSGALCGAVIVVCFVALFILYMKRRTGVQGEQCRRTAPIQSNKQPKDHIKTASAAPDSAVYANVPFTNFRSKTTDTLPSSRTHRYPPRLKRPDSSLNNHKRGPAGHRHGPQTTTLYCNPYKEEPAIDTNIVFLY